MTVSVLTKLTLEQSLKVIVSSTNVARFIIGVLKFLFVYSCVLNLDSFALTADLVESGSAIWALVGEL